MKQYFIFLLFFPMILFSQTIFLNWEEPKQYYEERYSDKIFPSFKEGNMSIINNVPLYSKTFDIDKNVEPKITNLEWEIVAENKLGATDLENIPTKDYIIAERHKSAKGYKGYIEIIPFKRDNNNYYRLKSYALHFQTLEKISNLNNKINFTDSVLKQSDFYKIKVDTTGIYKLDYNFFASNGLNPANINPSTIKIYGNGGAMLSEKIDDFRFEDLVENAIEVVDGNDGSFDAGDYILFYARGPHSFKRNLLTQPFHITHLYEDYAYYFLSFGNTIGKRVQSITPAIAPNYNTIYDSYRVVEPELLNPNEVGKIWVGKKFNDEPVQNFSFQIENIDTNTPIKYALSLYTSQGTNTNVKLDINNTNILDQNIISNLQYREELLLGNYIGTTNTYDAQVTVDNSANPSATIWFNYLELSFKQNLVYNGSQLSFRRFDNINNGNLYGFRMSNATSLEQIWDVSDPTNAIKLNNTNTGNLYDISYSSTHLDFPNEFIAFKESAALQVEFVGKVKNQNLHGLTNINYLIITPQDFKPAAQRLAQYHSEENLYNVAIVSPEEIYNEFSSGSQDVSAIRDFVRYVYQRNNTLEYLLLLGDASYDYKNRIANNSNFVPTIESFNSISLESSYASDDFFCILDDGEANLSANGDANLASSQLDISVGRLPANSITQANTLIDKILMYQNQMPNQSNPFGIWRLKNHLVVDDNNEGGTAFHQVLDQSVAQYIENDLPIYTLRKLYLDSFTQVTTAGGQRYPAVNTGINNGIETGTLFMNYFGHGGPRGWAQERIITQDDLVSYNNLNNIYTRLPLITTVTCDFTVWDNPNLTSGGEFLIKDENGGVMGTITTSRAIGVAYGKNFNGILVENLMTLNQEKHIPIGKGLMNAKIDYSSYDNRRVNLLGDPAIPLNYPPRNIKLNTINGQNAQSFNGTLRALDFVTLKGEVLQEDNITKDSSFNGKVEIALYDKPEVSSTLNNDGFLGNYTYTEQVKLLYNGSSTVNNGDFTIEFYVPNDINYNVGPGKLVLYAENRVIDAKLFKNDINIGGINPDGIIDDEPPVAKLFLNNRHFANGGISNNHPLFIACVTDSTGINATGLGIGHDITLILDNDINNTLVLNEYYQGGEQLDCPNPNLRDYQKGMASYNLRDIAKGPHTLTFKVWDINNNSTTETLDFIVAQEGEEGIVINRLLNWPNPFTNKTFFHFEHNCDEILEIQVQIFTIAGKLIKTIRQSVTSDPYREGYRTDKFGIEWDGLDDFGNKIGKGTYIYKLTAKGNGANSCTGSATAVEKLVILK